MYFFSSVQNKVMLGMTSLLVIYIIFISFTITTTRKMISISDQSNSASNDLKTYASAMCAEIHHESNHSGIENGGGNSEVESNHLHGLNITTPARNVPTDNVSAIDDVTDDVVKSRFEIEMAKLGSEVIGDPIIYDRNNLPPDLKVLGEEIFDHFPKAFLPEYKSPCWKSITGHLNCLPYFFIAGFPKCATTDLWNKITHHPDIFQTLKEPMWWTLGDYTVKGLNRYISHQTKLVEAMMRDARTDLINSDASALTLHDNRRLIKDRYTNDTLRKKLPYVTADIIRALLPNTKIIGIMRNPVDRAWSAYNYFGVRSGKRLSPQDFHQTIVQLKEKFYKCLEEDELRYCVYVSTGVPLMTGCYSIYLRDWLKRFPRDQFYFLRTEDFDKEDQPKILAEIFKFIDLPLPANNEIREMTMGKNKNAHPSRIRMLPKTRQLLADFYWPCNHDLATLLGDEKYLW